MPMKSPEKKSASQQNGFTLIEVMVSLAIFIIGIIGCYQMQVSFSASSSRANNVGNASTWAQYMAEELLAREYNDNNGTRTDALLKDTTNDGSAGVDAMTLASADGVRYVHPNSSIDTVAANSVYSVYWNIVDNRPLKQVKQIRIIVVKNSGLTAGRLYTQDYFKLGQI
jgi:prepilin-type N-terminal cleavage/methylation domain-containing protein